MRRVWLRAFVVMVCLIAVGSSAQEEGQVREAFSGYDGAPAFSVVPRQDELVYYPCSQCHEFMEPDTTVRELMSPHEIEFDHGQGRFWCFACHSPENRDELRVMNGDPVGYDDAHMVCGGCHGLRHKDWYFGAHGKRQSDWKERRVIYSCTHCHDAHDPVMAPREPMPGPGVRTGLEFAPPEHGHDKKPAWQSKEGDHPTTREDHE